MSNILKRHLLTIATLTVACLASSRYVGPLAAAPARHSFASVVSRVQPRIVKLYGAGGVRGLEPYQSGFLISPDGHVLTVMSYVLDTDFLVAVLNDGRRFEAELIGLDPQLEVAVLKIEAEGLPHFQLDETPEVVAGSRVLAFSNLFNVAVGNEPASVLHGCISAITNLDARRGAYKTPYRGRAFILDVLTNNPGAAGGALTDREGRLIGLLGKELRNSLDNTWLNYAMPVQELQPAVEDILAGRVRPRVTSAVDRKPLEPVTLVMLGISLVPDVLAKTPPYIDHVYPDSAASDAGLQVNDMVIFVNDELTRSVKELKGALTYIDRIDEVRLVVLRGDEVLEMSLFAPE